ncbi:MAG: MBL fold metallo-hydrolase [Oscillospiraceae bacterium]|jgi:ribonuclease Z|nr:MBL fold metallo-hydrolase [Oscillospiraceae bacterium]
MKLTMLGTGNALVTECYNTCFVIEDNNQYFMVDGGGGSAILHQLKHAGYDWMDMRHIFVTHKHVDHLMGIIWMVRMICQFMNHGEYKGEAYIYSHKEVLDLIRDMAGKLLLAKETRFIDDRLHLVEVHDGETMNIIKHDITFFDIHSTKAAQYGFCMDIGDGRKLTCCGDEPYNSCEEKYAKDSEWLLHETFCLYSQRDIFDPYEKHHSTVKDACELAEKLRVKNLLLYHTEDRNITKRKVMYQEEGAKYYNGNLLIPDDLEVIEL